MTKHHRDCQLQVGSGEWKISIVNVVYKRRATALAEMW